MKNIRFTYKIVLVATLIVACGGCAMFGKTSHQGSDLDEWLRNAAIPEITERLRTDTYLRGLDGGKSFLIVNARGEVVDRNIDKLTEYLRSRLEDELLKHPGIRLARRHNVEAFDKPYRFQDVRCDTSPDIEMLLTIDIFLDEFNRENHGRVRFRAIDLGVDQYVPGFSVFSEGPLKLTPMQKDALSTTRRDEYLRGLKYLPFSSGEHDEVGAYLARNLTCIFKEGYGYSDINVYIDASKLQRHNRNIVRFMENQLNFSNEINITNRIDNAGWVIEVESLETGVGSGLQQLWVSTYHREDGRFVPGLSTYAYIDGSTVPSDLLAGTWEIKEAGRGSLIGFMTITGSDQDGYRATLHASDRIAIIAEDFFIRVSDARISSTFYDRHNEKQTRISGVWHKERDRIEAFVSTFPGSVNKSWIMTLQQNL